MVHGYGLIEVQHNNKFLVDPQFGIENYGLDSLFLQREVDIFITKEDEKNREIQWRSYESALNHDIISKSDGL